LFGNGLLVRSNREATFGDVEDAARGAAVAHGIMQDSLWHTIGIQVTRREAGGVGRKRHRACEATAIENKSARGQAGRAAWTIAQVSIDKGLNARIGGAKVITEQAFLFIMIAEQRTRELQEITVSGILRDRLAEGSELEVKVLE
jgi:hypothetical protein